MRKAHQKTLNHLHIEICHTSLRRMCQAYLGPHRQHANIKSQEPSMLDPELFRASRMLLKWHSPRIARFKASGSGPPANVQHGSAKTRGQPSSFGESLTTRNPSDSRKKQGSEGGDGRCHWESYNQSLETCPCDLRWFSTSCSYARQLLALVLLSPLLCLKQDCYCDCNNPMVFSWDYN